MSRQRMERASSARSEKTPLDFHEALFNKARDLCWCEFPDLILHNDAPVIVRAKGARATAVTS